VDGAAAPAPRTHGRGSPREGVRALDGTRRNRSLGHAAPDAYATVTRSPLSQSERIASPLDVRGDLGGVRFAYRLGDGGATRFERRFPRAAPGAKLHVVVTPVPPSRLLTAPGAATGADAVRAGRAAEAGRLGAG